MKPTRLLDAALIAALLLANIPELTQDALPDTPPLALIAPVDAPDDKPAPRQ